MTTKIVPLLATFALGFGLCLSMTSVHGASLVDGSAEEGQNIAITCTACHGLEGNSVTPVWPNLAGQNAPYLLAQLRAFKDSTRMDPLMLAPVATLSDQDMKNLAVYFEGLPAAAQAVADESASVIRRGEALYRGGDMADETTACLACHGPTGRGNPAAKYPALRGQHADYTAKQLRDYASATRVTDGKTRMMHDVAATLNADDIAALSSYVQGLK